MQAIFTAGYKAILHLHSLVEECEIIKLLAQIDIKTKERKKVGRALWQHSQRNVHAVASQQLTAFSVARQAKFVKSGSVVIARIQVEKPICAELFENVPQLGRFTLRDEGRTIAIGKVIKLPKSLKEAS